MKISNTVLAYFAGFVDGEGCIGLIKKERKDRTICIAPRVVVVQKTKEVLKELQLYFGGSLRLRKNNGFKKSYIYVWSVSNKKAYLFIELIYSYLRIKKSQAMLILEYKKFVETNQHKTLTQKVIEDRLEFKHRMHILNGSIPNAA